MALLCLATTLGLTGCSSEATTTEKRLRAALRATEHLAHRFAYRETFVSEAEKRETEVRGLVEDDLRYKARVSVGGVAVLDEVVSDDALAVRLIQPAALDEFLRRPTEKGKSGSGVGSEEPGAPEAATPIGSGDDAPDPVAALRSRRWVLDKAGAPAVFSANPAEERGLGEDPVLDALDIFAHVERAIDEAAYVGEFNEESIEPVYRKDEDPFAKPEKGSEVIRYDFAAPKLPKASDRAGGNQVTPDARHFRKMAVYVKDGRVLQVSEVIDVASRLDDLAEVYETRFPKDRKPEEVAAVAIDALNTIRTGQGQDPIRLRTMSYNLKDLGDPVTVDMPGEVVETSLSLLQNRGRPADEAAGVALANVVRTTSFTAAVPGPG
ncbi:MAG: hypothetical protein M3357_16285 [Actinomycetota bacterium]|nr:hypothetical protein [Actinomycetota bacterium]